MKPFAPDIVRVFVNGNAITSRTQRQVSTTRKRVVVVGTTRLRVVLTGLREVIASLFPTPFGSPVLVRLRMDSVNSMQNQDFAWRVSQDLLGDRA